MFKSESGKCPVAGYIEASLALILVHAFTKQSNKTPKEEIHVALRRRDVYLSLRGCLE
jgi:phage-related protein